MNALSAKSLLSYQPADTSEPILDVAIGDALRAAAEAWPDRPALIEGVSERALRRRWTFAQALQEAENVGRALAQRFRPGEHVAIWAANLPEWFFAQFGAALAGLTLVTVNPAYLAAELAYVLKQSRACGVLVQDHYRGRDLLAAVATVRETLPALREVIPLSTWTQFAASGAREGRCRRFSPGTSRRSSTRPAPRARRRAPGSPIAISSTTAGSTPARSAPGKRTSG
jgi:fatty-acyl-CoA synthase